MRLHKNVGGKPVGILADEARHLTVGSMGKEALPGDLVGLVKDRVFLTLVPLVLLVPDVIAAVGGAEVDAQQSLGNVPSDTDPMPASWSNSMPKGETRGRGGCAVGRGSMMCLRSSAPPHHNAGIERPRCVDRLPNHISKMVVSTVCGGGPKLTVDRTIFEMRLAL